ncbi:unnamed protein product [Diamesa hyperborea]
MADVENVNGVADDVVDKKQKKHDSGAADLERVTDYAEEKEISKDIAESVNLFAEKRNKENEEKLAKEHELQKVAIKKEDIELIMDELEISRCLAEKTLRENNGNIVDALKKLVEV